MGVLGGDNAELREAAVALGAEKLCRFDTDGIVGGATVRVADNALTDAGGIDAVSGGHDVSGDVGALDTGELDVASPCAHAVFGDIKAGGVAGVRGGARRHLLVVPAGAGVDVVLFMPAVCTLITTSP